MEKDILLSNLSIELDSVFSAIRHLTGLEIEHLTFCGGNSLIPGLLNQMNQALGIPVDIADPLKFIDYNRDIFGGDDPALLSPSLVVAMGLAMRGLIL